MQNADSHNSNTSMTMMLSKQLTALLSISACLEPSFAFAPASGVQSFNFRDGIKCSNGVVSGRAPVFIDETEKSLFHQPLPGSIFANNGRRLNNSSTSLSMAAMANALGIAKNLAVSPKIRQILLFLSATVTTLVASFAFSKRYYTPLLWPGTNKDPTVDAPLPKGSFGCPFFGYDIMSGSRDYGPFATLNSLRKKLGNPKIFSLYAFGYPIVSVSGAENVKEMLSHEFDPDGINTELFSKQNLGPLFGAENILYEGDKNKHGMLRRLMGVAMTPPAIAAGIPAIQAAANDSVDRILSSDGSIKMEDVANDFTLDIAWRQILGLDLKDQDEIIEFRQKVHDWIQMATNPLIYIFPFRIPGLMTLTKEGRARVYLEKKIEEKLAKLDEFGPDSSTLSKMYFARDEDGKSGLSRRQLLDNALILIFAGSETSSATLSCASLFLALHPDVFKKIKLEQDEIRSKYGDVFTKDAVEDCKYLDAVVKETLRLKPVEGSELRKVENTIIVDGKQIPRGWYAMYNPKHTHIYDPATYLDDESHMDERKGFKPERWLNEATKPTQWMPFGDGQRRCLGERLGMTEMKIFIATLARRVEYNLVNEISPGEPLQWNAASVMARPLGGVEVRARASV